MPCIISVLSGLRGAPQGTYVSVSSLVGHRIVTTAYYRKEPVCFAILYVLAFNEKWFMQQVVDKFRTEICILIKETSGNTPSQEWRSANRQVTVLTAVGPG